MFSKLGLSSPACASLARLGYETPTPIQTEAIPLVLTGVDLLARAQTGTGKTAAFGLPMIERLLTASATTSRVTPRALVLVPTRELPYRCIRRSRRTLRPRVFASSPSSVVSVWVRQIQALRRGADIVVATPGRLIDHLQRRTVDLSAVEVLTLDEADRMLDMGFLPALRTVVAALPRDASDVVVLRNAVRGHDPTLGGVHAQRRACECLSRTSRSRNRDTPGAPRRHRAQARRADPHPHARRRGQALVFCKTKRGANRVGEDLGQRGVRTGIIHGNKSQNARSRALDDFKSGRVRVLVATDIAARGLDIAHLPLVVNFDLPLVAEDYVHRVGRTGRAGQHGRAVSLVSASEAGLLRQIQQVVAAPLERVAAPIVATEAHRGDRARADADARGSWIPVGARPVARERQSAAQRRQTPLRLSPRGQRRPIVSRVTPKPRHVRCDMRVLDGGRRPSHYPRRVARSSIAIQPPLARESAMAGDVACSCWSQVPLWPGLSGSTIPLRGFRAWPAALRT